MRPGVRLGVDVGSVRVGVARCDPSGILATPVETLSRDTVGGTDVERIAALVQEWEAVEVLVGFPRSLSGRQGPAADSAAKYAVQVARRVAPVPVRLVDERFSTVAAHRTLRSAGVRGRKVRPIVDQAAAVVILQNALDAEQASGQPPGSLVAPDHGPDGPDRSAGG